jgi:solute carrier family 25 (mitochondrial phosphate transporter), member 3
MAQTKPQAPGAVTPQKKIELFSGTYFAACTIGGVIGNLTPPSTLVTTTETPN